MTSYLLVLDKALWCVHYRHSSRLLLLYVTTSRLTLGLHKIVATKRGRPRLDPLVRSRIIQIFAALPEDPPTISAIDGYLVDEFGDSPSRGAIHKVIADWKAIPEKIRSRDYPFEWQRLDKARIPWEASDWILRCIRLDYENQVGAAGFAHSLDIDLGTLHIIAATFTNRLATWCWRIHLAAPDLIPEDVQPLSLVCAAQERMKDIADRPMEIGMIEDWLVLRPDRERRYGVKGAWQRYWDAVGLGIVKNPIPKTPDEAVEYVTTMLIQQQGQSIFRWPGAEHFYTGPNPVNLWHVLHGYSPPSMETTAKTEESKEESNEGLPTTTQQD